MKKLLILILLLLSCEQKSAELQGWEDIADRVEIIRDNWGIPHIYGKTDADAVFGMLYSQCEDDFNRVEMNYINAMGRASEFTGEKDIYKDLRMKMFIDIDDMKAKYEKSPERMKKLMDAFADGINYYLHMNPEVKPKVITKFEPWMALTFSEGSIGGDIERVRTRTLKEFYGSAEKDVAAEYKEGFDEFMKEPVGSNGISISPKLTTNGNSLFLINPHTSFFFRSEVHMVSEEGLNAYGAVTWGQFFIYQGFNDKTGWMHTSSRADAIDYYFEKVSEVDGKMTYKHGTMDRELTTKMIKVPYKTETGMAEKEFKVYYSHHGPIIGKADENKWVSISLMQEEMKALIQSYDRTKTTGWDSFREMMNGRTNSSNNTVYADAEGNIGYFHGNYVPIRDPKYDWNSPLDGSDPGTDYRGLHEVEDLITLLNPKNGWIQNTNSTPFTAAAEYSPKAKDYPSYMAPDKENYRGLHAVEVLKDKYDWTLDKLITAAYDSRLVGFDELLPALIKAYHKTGDTDRKREVHDAMKMLKKWDKRYSLESIETTVASFWGMEAMSAGYASKDRNGKNIYKYIAEDMSAEKLMEAFTLAIDILEADFGTWKTAWGEVNRLQRLTADIKQPFNDDKPSIGIPFASARWGSLASFGADKYQTKKLYGTYGNSFVAVVEFGEKVVAKSIVNGGQSSDVNSPHFHDQAEMYAKGEFKDVYYYREDVEKSAEEKYKPGQRKKGE